MFVLFDPYLPQHSTNAVSDVGGKSLTLPSAWRKVLKDLIAYFRDIQKSYEIERQVEEENYLHRVRLSL